MKNILLMVTLLSLNSCMLIKGWDHYSRTDGYGRASLDNMRFKNSFKPKMSSSIDIDAVYFNHCNPSGIDYEHYSYIRLFANGQYAVFVSRSNNRDVNNVYDASSIGYYKIRKNKLLLEKAAYRLLAPRNGRIIRKYKILEDGNLQDEYKKIFTKTNPNQLPEVTKNNELKRTRATPDW